MRRVAIRRELTPAGHRRYAPVGCPIGRTSCRTTTWHQCEYLDRIMHLEGQARCRYGSGLWPDRLFAKKKKRKYKLDD